MKNKKIKITIILLSVLLCISIAALATVLIRKGKESVPATVSVPDNLITSSSESGSSGETKTGENESSSVTAAASSGNTSSAVNREKAIAEALRLYKKNPQENEPFKVTDMFPGDKETKYFRVRVSHNGTVTVRYHADVRQGSEKLAEVLKVKITLLTTGEEMYNGLMRDMPKSLSHTLNSNGDAEDELYYEITAYLETDTGNEYQNKQLTADFKWWVEETGNLIPPKTGDSSAVLPWAAAAAVSGCVIIVLIARRRREEEENA